MVYLMMLSVGQMIQHQIVEWLVNSEFATMWKEGTMG